MNDADHTLVDCINRFPHQPEPKRALDPTAETSVASCVLRGEASYLVAGQAKVLGGTQTHEIYQLNTQGECRIAVWDKTLRALVVFDTAALCALATHEVQANAKPIDPPSRL